MAHVFVAPHLDDAALSCAGYAGRLASRGRVVLIATVCTADAPDGWPLSAAAQHVHAEWQLGAHPYARRRAEDERACALLGAGAVHLGLLDAVYRLDDAGRALYQRQFIGVAPHALDARRHVAAVTRALSPVLDALSAEGRAPLVYAPLGIGGHVDHTLTRRAVERIVPASNLRYYEDYPYAGWEAARLAPAFTAARRTAGLRARRVRLSGDEVDLRLRAIACYPSQMFALFGDANMPTRVREYISRVQGERYWQRQRQ